MSGIFMLYQNLAHEPSYAGGGGALFLQVPTTPVGSQTKCLLICCLFTSLKKTCWVKNIWHRSLRCHMIWENGERADGTAYKGRERQI